MSEPDGVILFGSCQGFTLVFPEVFLGKIFSISFVKNPFLLCALSFSGCCDCCGCAGFCGSTEAIYCVDLSISFHPVTSVPLNPSIVNASDTLISSAVVLINVRVGELIFGLRTKI